MLAFGAGGAYQQADVAPMTLFGSIVIQLRLPPRQPG